MFESTGSMTSITKDAQFEVCQFEDRIIEVVDAPGTNETGVEETKAIDLVVNAIVKALEINPEGFHAFLLVLRYGLRHTNEEEKAINILKGILGQSFLKTYGIVIMCGGDDFLHDHCDKKVSCKDYCSGQVGSFKTLLEECNGRIILFNNRATDEAVKYQQVKDLVTMVDQLPSKGERYTNEHFKKAEKERNLLYVTASVPMIEKETLVQHKIILYRINLIQSEPGEQKKIDSFKQLLSHIENLIQEIETKDKGTGALKFIWENVQNSKTAVNDLIVSCQDVIREREQIKTTEEKFN
ncbi:uncharacterized protein LOC131944162 [Physella acuta]|uniref:uncharacterized protein LOC131944162 n=1 Tax=Physella acuta TaxID=109671 RepID=UPI0027DD189C|nr:uncharacterized protein LOC131944162 [Physella acuta]